MMDWNKLLSYQKVGEKKKLDFDDERDPFLVDFDRIIFSDPFRRLDKKTQVHPLKTNDNVHSRLSHSMEVASVGRSLGTAVGFRIKDELPEPLKPFHLGEIMTAACLAHDIGNPPFGHAGEEAIRDWFSSHEEYLRKELTPAEADDLKSFEGNAQALRILTRLEMYKNEGGIRPSYAVIAALMKYPWINGKIDRPKFGAFLSEKDILTEIAEHTGLVRQGDHHYSRHPLAFLSEASDDICYRIIDLEDAHELGILSYQEVSEILMPICDDEKACANIQSSGSTEKEKIGHFRSRAIGGCKNAVADSFMKNYGKIMSGELPFSHNLVYNSAPHVSEAMSKAKKVAESNVFTERRKTVLEIGAYNILGILLDNFVGAVHEKHFSTGGSLSFKTSRLLQILYDHAVPENLSLYESYLNVTDYIAGMTDNFATKMAQELTGHI